MRIGESHNIKEIAPILADVFLDGFMLSDDSVKNYQNYYNLNQETLGLLNKYLNNQMTDYEIVSIERDEDALKIEINDLSYCLMAEKLLKKKSEVSKNKNILFPFKLLFKNVTHYSINEVKKDGELLEISDYSIIPNSQILFDQLIYIDKNTIEIGLSLWKFMEGKGSNFLLLISAQSCHVLEKQMNILNKWIKGDIPDY